MSAPFAPGAYVFPGGKIDDKDQAYASLYLRSRPGCPLTLTQATQACTALRESFEELGLVLLEDAQGRRFWLFRHGLYGTEKPNPDWYLHGLFG